MHEFISFTIADEKAYSKETADLMEEGYKLAELLLKQNGGDFDQIAKDLEEYEVASTWLAVILPTFRANRPLALRALRLVEEMARMLNSDDIDHAVNRAWAIELAARSIITKSLNDSLSYDEGKKRPPEERFAFYPKVLETLQAWLEEGKYLINLNKRWRQGLTKWGLIADWKLFANRNRCKSRANPFTFNVVHELAHEFHRQKMTNQESK